MDLHDMKITPEERNLLDWCFANLDEEQRVDCEDEAMELATQEINAPEAADLLVRLYHKIVVRNFREEMNATEMSDR